MEATVVLCYRTIDNLDTKIGELEVKVQAWEKRSEWYYYKAYQPLKDFVTSQIEHAAMSYDERPWWRSMSGPQKALQALGPTPLDYGGTNKTWLWDITTSESNGWPLMDWLPGPPLATTGQLTNAFSTGWPEWAYKGYDPDPPAPGLPETGIWRNLKEGTHPKAWNMPIALNGWWKFCTRIDPLFQLASQITHGDPPPIPEFVR